MRKLRFTGAQELSKATHPVNCRVSARTWVCVIPASAEPSTHANQEAARGSFQCVPKQVCKLEMQYLVERRGRLLWAGAGRNVPFEACDCRVAGDWDRQPITEEPSLFLWVFALSFHQRIRLHWKKDMKLKWTHQGKAETQAAPRPSRLTLGSKAGKLSFSTELVAGPYGNLAGVVLQMPITVSFELAF